MSSHRFPSAERLTECISSPEFQNLVETVLDGTLGNLLQEANLDEWDLTKHRIALYI